VPELSKSEMAEQFGFALAFLKSDKSLWKLFNSAVKGNWDAARFQAKLKNTSFYKKNSESARNYDLLRTTDPASFNQQRTQLRAQIHDAAATMGANMSGNQLTRITQNAMKYGWNDSQIRDTLGQYVKAVNGVYRGEAGQNIQQVESTAYKNGIKLSAQTRQKWAQSIAAGNNSASFYEQQVRNMAKSLAPSYSDQLQAGLDLMDIASPYIESKAQILEMNPADIDLFDKDIRGAMSGINKDGKPTSKSLWQFEQDMRKSPAWLKTKNAQDSTMSVAKQVLTDMGFKS
jgi:hypothetical protein